MCGIVGYVRSNRAFVKDARPIMQDLLFLDTLRGRCGTGVAGITVNNELEINKKSVPGPDYLESVHWERAGAALDTYQIVIGHNRAGTIGAVKDRNAHPFHFKGKFGEIVLVHNGTLNQYHMLGPTAFTHEVDSAYACAEIAENGPEKALEKIRGWYVFVWYDLTHKTFNVARNNNRDFSWCYDKDGNMFFASEWEMMDYVLGRRGHEIIKIPGAGKNVYFGQMPEMSWYEWDMSGEPPYSLTKFKRHTIVPKNEPAARVGGGRHKWEDDDEGHDWSRYPALHSPIPPRNNHRSEGEQRLIDVGFQPGQKVRVVCVDWEAYPRNEHLGTIEGFLADKPHTTVSIPSVSKLVWNGLTDEEAGDFPVELKTHYTKKLKGKDEEVIFAMPDYEALRVIRAAKKLENDGASKSTTQLEIVTVVGPAGVFIPVHNFLEATRQGCAVCGNPVIVRDAKDLLWNNNMCPPACLCLSCQNIPDNLEKFNGTKAKGAA